MPMMPTPGWTLRHDGRTRAALGAWVGVASFAGVHWVAAHALQGLGLAPSWPWPMLAASIAGVSGAAYGAWLLPSDTWHMHWRSDQWWLASMSDPAIESAGQVRPMIDLGPWVLLRFQPDQGGTVRWLAVRAGSTGGEWHALRAALFWPRSETPGPAIGPARLDGH